MLFWYSKEQTLGTIGEGRSKYILSLLQLYSELNKILNRKDNVKVLHMLLLLQHFEHLSPLASVAPLASSPLTNGCFDPGAIGDSPWGPVKSQTIGPSGWCNARN